MEDDKETTFSLEGFSKIMDLRTIPKQDSNSWFNLFPDNPTFLTSSTFAWPNGNELRLLAHLAASDPLSLFHSTEFDGEGVSPQQFISGMARGFSPPGSIHLL
jgi:hypothetical protein